MKSNTSPLLWAGLGYALYQAARSAVREARMDEYPLANKVVLITGGSRGLGLVLARLMAAQGARLALVARELEELQRAQQDLAHYGTEVEVYPADVTDQQAVDAMVQQVQGRYGTVDVLINCAGIIQVGPMELMEVQEYEQSIKTHLWGPLYVIRAVAPAMMAAGQGRIVNIASIGGKVSIPHLLPYSVGKFALVGLSQGLHHALANYGIKVTTVSPGLMRTGSHLQVELKGRHSAEYSWFSIMNALPFSSVSAEYAAHRIVDALRAGDAELIIGAQAKLLAYANALFPELTSTLLRWANQALPRPEGDGSVVKGSEVHTALTPSLLTTLADKAATKNNERKGAAAKAAR